MVLPALVAANAPITSQLADDASANTGRNAVNIASIVANATEVTDRPAGR